MDKILIFTLLFQSFLGPIPVHAAPGKQCTNFVKSFANSFDNATVSVGSRYNRNKSLPWLIRHTGHNPKKITRSAIIDSSNFKVSVPINMLGDNTSTFDDYFLEINYEYGSIPIKKNSAGEYDYSSTENYSLFYLSRVKIVDFFGDTPSIAESKKVKKFLEDIRIQAKTLVRKKDTNTINIQLNETSSFTLYPFFRQSTIEMYLAFMEKFFYSSQYDILRTVKNRWIKLRNDTIDAKSPRLYISKIDQTSLTEIETYRQYELRLQKLSTEKVFSIILDRAVYQTIGYSLIPLGIGVAILFSYGKNAFKIIFPIDESKIPKSIGREDVKNIIEEKIKSLNINNTFEKLLETNPEFKEAVQSSGIPLDTVFTVNVQLNNSKGGLNIFKVEFEGVNSNGDTIRFSDQLPLDTLQNMEPEIP